MVLKELVAVTYADEFDFTQVIEEPMIINGCYVMDPDIGKLKTSEAVQITPTNKTPGDILKAITGIVMGKNRAEVNFTEEQNICSKGFRLV